MAEAKVTQQALLALVQGEPEVKVTQQALLVLYVEGEVPPDPEPEAGPRRTAAWLYY